MVNRNNDKTIDLINLDGGLCTSLDLIDVIADYLETLDDCVSKYKQNSTHENAESIRCEAICESGKLITLIGCLRAELNDHIKESNKIADLYSISEEQDGE
ncbi:hypothetical protein [Paucilactobacillus nenjiangensis]|uniref:hypothetical protein n=1 Tax=Paucilactobacillus nenjiangensis TaxID=1296540 RepID=UPI0010F462D6|nr:hypothetical protein [Paucilactobacillus nenjiangensis]